jgi:Domain of unknown function (DUF4234)
MSDVSPGPETPRENAPVSETPGAPTGSTPAAAPPPQPPVPVSRGEWGPPGQIRNWITVALLTIVTCGIYGIFWQYYLFRDNKTHSGEGVGGAIGAILAIFLSIVTIFLLPAEIGNIYAKAGQEKPVSGLTGFWALIPIAGFFIWVYKVQTAVNERWEQMGATPLR